MNNINMRVYPVVTYQTGQQSGTDNYDDANIADIKNAWEEERIAKNCPHQAYTMVQSNASQDVTVTKESRQACVKALLR